MKILLLDAQACDVMRGQLAGLRLSAEPGSGAEALIHDLGYTRADGAAGAHVMYTKTLLMPEAA